MKQIGTTAHGDLVEIAEGATARIGQAITAAVYHLNASIAAIKVLDAALTLESDSRAPAGHPVNPLLVDAAAPFLPAVSSRRLTPEVNRTGKGARTSAAKGGVTKPARTPAHTGAAGPDSGETRKCLHCGKAFAVKRKDARFCSKTCRRDWWNASRNGKGKKPKIKPGRACTKTCVECGKSYVGQPNSKTCGTICAKARAARQTDVSHRKTKPRAAAIPPIPPVPGKAPASAPEADDAKARRLAAIRSADARLRSKGLVAPSVFGGGDSGIREASEDEIAALRRQAGQ